MACRLFFTAGSCLFSAYIVENVALILRTIIREDTHYSAASTDFPYEPVPGELLIRLQRATDIAHGNKISTGVG